MKAFQLKILNFIKYTKLACVTAASRLSSDFFPGRGGCDTGYTKSGTLAMQHFFYDCMPGSNRCDIGVM